MHQPLLVSMFWLRSSNVGSLGSGFAMIVIDEKEGKKNYKQI